MIYDRLENISAYKGLSSAMNKAIDFLQCCGDIEALPEGPIIIDGELAFGSLSTVEHRTEGLCWESHRRYIDIQISLTGGETIGACPVNLIAGWGAYEGDIRISHDAAPGIPLPMQKGAFAVFFPWDAHRPNEGTGPGKKIVLKVLYSD